ncbi:MAG: hypothetical protein M9887_11675 [Chitinophagales bacterium]|nr:hypothetical protein [Chitinophagales bacterium]
MNESEAYDYGQYETYEDALIVAKKIVDDFFIHNWEKGITPIDLLAQYCLYGEDPIILPHPDDERWFSARVYAEISTVEICNRLENQ